MKNTSHKNSLGGALRSCGVWATVSLWMLLTASGCGDATEAYADLGARALAEAEALVVAHPQRIAGVDSERVAQWICQRLGTGAELQPFDTPKGTMVNVVKPHPSPVAILVSHYDTKAGIPGFVGANDGASTTGLLLALAATTELPVTYLPVRQRLRSGRQR